MKKVLGIGNCIVGLLLVVFGGGMRMKENTAVSIYWRSRWFYFCVRCRKAKW